MGRADFLSSFETRPKCSLCGFNVKGNVLRKSISHDQSQSERKLAGSTARATVLLLTSCALWGSTSARNANAQDAFKSDAFGASAVTISNDQKSAIKGGLKYLASMQQPNGGWSASGNHQAAITGYAVIAFLATGNLPGEGEHGAVVQRGVDFLLSCVRPDGYIAAPIGQSNMYNHGVATLALAEVYGHGRDVKIRPSLERAVKLILKCQNAEGGWRYAPRVGDADVSVTVIQLSALRAAKNAGMDVPQNTIDLAVKYINSCLHPSGGFLYQPNKGGPGFARTAAAIYSLQVCGLYDDKSIPPAAEYLEKNLGKEGPHATYGHFYAGPAIYMIGGQVWSRWYAKVSSELMGRKRTEGERTWWERDSKNGESAMPVYYTSVNTTLLALPMGYMPLYQR